MDSIKWAALPKAPVPSDQSLLSNSINSNNFFYINAINIQGIIFSCYDHYAIIHFDNFIKLICWDDDPEDHPGDFKAIEWTFHEVVENTKQSWIGYYESEKRRESIKKLNIDILQYTGHWSEFVKPADSVTMHGIWMSDELYEVHKDVRSQVGWREWL